VKEIDQFVPSIFNVSCASEPFSPENLAPKAHFHGFEVVRGPFRARNGSFLRSKAAFVH
jgi:hypothetical protein